MTTDFTMSYFKLSNPANEPEYLSVPKLLRRAADAIDELGDVEMQDLVLHMDATPEGFLPTVHVYYSRVQKPPQSARSSKVPQ